MAEEDSRYLASLERDALRKVLDWPLEQARREISEDGRQVQGLVSVLYGISSPKAVLAALAPKLQPIGKYMVRGTCLGGARLILYPTGRRTGKVILQSVRVEGVLTLRCSEHFATGGLNRPGVSAKDILWERMVASMMV